MNRCTREKFFRRQQLAWGYVFVKIFAKKAERKDQNGISNGERVKFFCEFLHSLISFSFSFKLKTTISLTHSQQFRYLNSCFYSLHHCSQRSRKTQHTRFYFRASLIAEYQE